MGLWDQWWVWIVAGGLLALLELVIPTFILLGFALGALVVAGALWLGWLGGSVFVTLVVFAAASLVAWIALRRVIGVRRGQVKRWDTDIND